METSAMPTGGDLRAEAQAREAQKPSGPLEARLDDDRNREEALKNGERGQGQQGYSQPMSDTEKAKLDSLARDGVTGPAERRPDRQLEPAGQAGRTPGAQHQRDTQPTQDPERTR
ncbi:hypothetical protein [Kribbella italica]|uniref:Uncharacterized protein n=1 Tax=Kribbella italica TaxID=1540520 RepID=A0A7W9MXQ3_9ACTN|nr:hypothetical protein [Kribbella italica]MBB5840376.1 hypothetical protein [Kribbella italica]